MTGKKKQYGRIFFKLLLFAVYFIFFTVQLFLRFSSSQSQQFLGTRNYQKAAAFKSGATKNILSNTNPEKNNPSSYLNKHYHPKDAVVVSAHDFQLHCFYFELPAKFSFSKENVPGIKIRITSLRGPPVVA